MPPYGPELTPKSTPGDGVVRGEKLEAKKGARQGEVPFAALDH